MGQYADAAAVAADSSGNLYVTGTSLSGVGAEEIATVGYTSTSGPTMHNAVDFYYELCALIHLYSHRVTVEGSVPRPFD